MLKRGQHYRDNATDYVSSTVSEEERTSLVKGTEQVRIYSNLPDCQH